LAIDSITGNKNLKLRKYELEDDDWEIISDLIRVLKASGAGASLCFVYVLIGEQIYKDATMFFSQDSATTIAHVIPTMDRIDAVLRSTGDTALTPSVKHALTFTRKHLDKYYSKMDMSNVYRIAMGMCHLFSLPLVFSIGIQFCILN
jgi:hypothetical protein